MVTMKDRLSGSPSAFRNTEIACVRFALLDEGIGPYCLYQLVLGNGVTRILQQRQQLERLTR